VAITFLLSKSEQFFNLKISVSVYCTAQEAQSQKQRLILATALKISISSFAAKSARQPLTLFHHLALKKNAEIK
jgi:hypothetical protein